jgi:hypothetical protein
MLATILFVGALLPGLAALPNAEEVDSRKFHCVDSSSPANAAGHAVRALSEKSLYEFCGTSIQRHMSSVDHRRN